MRAEEKLQVEQLGHDWEYWEIMGWRLGEASGGAKADS